MRAVKAGIGVGTVAVMLGFATTTSDAQGARRGPPNIRIYSDNGVNNVGTTSYITPRVEVSENAYVFAVEMDMDGQIQVLHPDFPGLSVRIPAHKSLQLPNFFTGFNSSRYSMARSDYDLYGPEDSRGTVIALASRAPFNLEKIETAGDWDIAAIRRLIENRSPLSAAAVLAQYLGQSGEPIGRDYLRFDGGGGYGYPYYADSYGYYSDCAFYRYRFGYLQAFALYNQLRVSGRGLQLVGYDVCGTPIFTSRVVKGEQGTPIGHFPPSHGHADTTIFPKSRLPRNSDPRRPGTTVFANAPEGAAPNSYRPGTLPQMGDVTVKAVPTGRRSEPRQQLQDLGGGMAIPQGRIPVERVVTPRPAASGTSAPVPQYRREPQPVPARMPEPRHDAPPPRVIHERPASPAPAPPPRQQAPATRTEPSKAR